MKLASPLAAEPSQKRPKSVCHVATYLADGENNTAGHFGRSVGQRTDLSTRCGRSGSMGVVTVPMGVDITPGSRSRDTARVVENFAHRTCSLECTQSMVTRTEVRGTAGTTDVCFRHRLTGQSHQGGCHGETEYRLRNAGGQ